MIQYQYIYEDDSRLVKRLSEMRKLGVELKASNMLIRIFSTVTDEKVIENLCHILDKEYPEALYMGCTTNANILEGKFHENGISITFSFYTDPDTRINVIMQPLEGYSENQMLEEIPKIRKAFPGVKAVEALVSSYGMMESNLTKTFETYRSAGMLIYGGGAYTGDRNEDSLVFAKGFKPNSKALVVALFAGRGLHFEAKHISGWKPLGQSFKITSVEKNILKTLEDKPAFDVYSRYLDIQNDDSFEDNAIEFPFMCTTDDGKVVMRTPVSSNQDGSIVMFSEIDSFDSVRLSYGDKHNISDCITAEARALCDFRPDAISLFSCVARRAFWAEEIDKESSIFQSVAPTSGFYTSGEVMTENDKVYHHNETLLIIAVREGDIDPSIPPRFISDSAFSTKKSFVSRLAKYVSTATKEIDEMVESVEESRRLAEEANHAKSSFLANMSHEIRTPINAILGFDTMILRESRDEEIIHYANDIMSAGSNLLLIINDILDLSKIESGKMNIVDVEYELSSLVLDVVNMMRMKAEEKGLRVEVEVDKNIPSWLFGDDVRIRQIIINLMNNAVKYTETGVVSLSIDGTREGEYEKLHVEIKDTGMGIKPEDMDKLFEKFARIEEERNHNVEGTGLGMNITISLLSMMNSKLNVESEYGKGSTFSFEIKQKVMREEPIGDITNRSLEYHDESTYASTFTAPEANVLLVDDNHMNREVIIALLKKTKIHFDQADGGLTCLEKTLDCKYDLILLDHMMPDLDGIETLKRLRADEKNPNKDTITICMTANAIVGAMEEYLDAGFDGYISKPVKPDKLEKLLMEKLAPELIHAPSQAGEEPETQQEESATDNTEALPSINGIENEVALANLLSAKLVLKAMNMFFVGAQGEAERLMKSFDKIKSEGLSPEEKEEALGEYRVQVHAMKSSAQTIGAVMVSNLAKFLEFSARDKNVENILSVTVPFLNEWRALAKRLKDEFGSKEEAPTKSAECDVQRIKESLEKLETVIGEMDIDAADEIMITLSSAGIENVDASAFEELKQAVLNIDLEKISDACKKFVEKMSQ